MTEDMLTQSIDFIMGQFKILHPGEIIMLPTLESLYRKNRDLPDKYFSVILNLLIKNDYLKLKNTVAICLTERGFAYLHKKELIQLNIDIASCVAHNNDRKTYFYNIWDIIGTETEDENPFYIKGTDYYSTIKDFLQGLPSTVSQYLEDIKEKEKRNIRRSEWYWNLFSQLADSQIQPFLDKLSALINRRNQIPIQKDDLDLDDIDVEKAQEITNDNIIMEEAKKPKTPKVFISHKTEDREYAKALVDLMLGVGVKEKQIFCSSYEGFGIPLGQNIFDYIKKQYEEHDLLVIFIHSPRYYQSPISMNEMGAAWILKKQHVSFLTSDCEFEMLKGVVTSGETAFKAGKKDTYHYLNDFKESLEEFFNIEPIKTTRWDTIRNDFLVIVEKIDYQNK